MDNAGHVSQLPAGCPWGAVALIGEGRVEPSGRRTRRLAAALAALLLPVLPAVAAAGQAGGLFTAVGSATPVAAARVSPTPSDALTLRQRLVTIDFGQLAPTAAPAGAGAETARRGVLTLNLFDDAAFTGLVEQVARPSREASRCRAGSPASSWGR